MEDLVGCKADEEKIDINEACKCSTEDDRHDHAIMKEEDRRQDEVESAKSEMAGVREENVRLKSLLQQIENDYKALQMRFTDVSRRDDDDKSKKIESPIMTASAAEDQEQDQLVSLRLGLNCSFHEGTLKSDIVDNKCKKDQEDGDEAAAGRKWPPSKAVKTQRSGEDDELISETSSHVKRARVCVRARCDTPTMNDGCHWRKYGQKIAKGNPCPRAYYRCTVSTTCPVRKQVQRCMEDMSILITTYEGTHNHPLPISATAMASTTSAAASMLLSGSSTTSHPPPPPQPTFRPYGNSRVTELPNNYFLPTYNSPSTTFPTITLDLTTNPSAAHDSFGLYSSTTTSRTNYIPSVLSPTSLSFSSIDSNSIPTGFSYGTFPYKIDQQLLPEKPAQEQEYRSYLEKFTQASSSQQALTETLTKVITADASFRSVIAAAISTMAANSGGGESASGTTSKWGDQHIPATNSNHLT